jgi:ABC-type nitrate/sulfonate/bicarbonate transport system permease component
VLPAFSVASALAAWFLATQGTDQGSVLSFPSPAAVLAVLGQHWATFLEAAGLTMMRVVSGSAIGTFVGVAFGILCCRYGTLFRLSNPLIEIVRPIPPIALTPFFILWLGLGTLSQISLIALGAFMIAFVSTTGAIANLDRIYERAFLLLGGSRSGLVRAVWLPAIMPELTSAIRITLATAFALTVAAEYLGAQGGLGYIIRNARTLLDTGAILIAAAALGLSSFLLDLVVHHIMRSATGWVARSGED